MFKKIIVIPAYNEQEAILHTVSAIQRDVPEFDYVVINDCSTDSTRELLDNNQINHIDLPLNLGIGGAVQTGYQYAYQKGYDIAVQIDGDGQHVPKYLNEMADILTHSDADMIIGSRFIQKDGFQSSHLRRMGIAFFSGLIRICTGKRVTDPTSGQRMIGKKIIGEFAENYPKDYPEPETVVSVLRKGYKIKEIPVIMHEREGRKTSIGFINSCYYMVKVTLAILMEMTRGTKRHD